MQPQLLEQSILILPRNLHYLWGNKMLIQHAIAHQVLKLHDVLTQLTFVFSLI